ncbi:MAG: hypothetical protein Q9190_004347 [Brigantiaea leucoxantha]
MPQPISLLPTRSKPLPDTSTPPTSSPNRPLPRSYSPASTARISVKNRRKHYLDTHPEYFTSPSHQLADPTSYSHLILPFLSTQEREASASSHYKTFSDVIEAAVAGPLSLRQSSSSTANGSSLSQTQLNITNIDDDETPPDKQSGQKRWHALLESRFVAGQDADFDYATLDHETFFGSEGAEQERDEEEKWFGAEEEMWVTDDGSGGGGGGERDTDKKNALQTILKGQTGIQDF